VAPSEPGVPIHDKVTTYKLGALLLMIVKMSQVSPLKQNDELKLCTLSSNHMMNWCMNEAYLRRDDIVCDELISGTAG
jgi:hypothetical protein